MIHLDSLKNPAEDQLAVSNFEIPSYKKFHPISNRKATKINF
jgi:hypothetical protein